MSVKMFKRRILARKSVNSGFEDIHHSCTVRFLDDSDPLTVTYQNDTKGQYLIDHVCSSLDLVEKDYFGLRYVDKDKQRHWIDPLKSAQKQLKDVVPPTLSFRVKYYPSDPARVKEDITRYYLFLQLVRDLHRGRLLCNLEQAIDMSAFILQAEFGDYEVEFPTDYLTQAKMIPKQIQGHENEVIEKHKTLKSQTPADIEILFLDMAAKLDTYGVDPQPVKDSAGTSMYLGVTHQGIVTFQGDTKANLLTWSQIDKLDFEGKHFVIVLSSAGKKQKHDYKCPSAVACKSLWKYAVQQRYFFTLNSSSSAPKVTAGRGLFRRGSSYRFKGHCQSEVFAESAGINRDAPMFTRWASNPQFFRTSGSIGTGSLPNAFRCVSLTEDNIAAFESSQSDVSALDSIRNSSRIEDSLLEEPSPTPTPTSDTLDQPPLSSEPPISKSGLLNHVSEPLATVEEASGTPEPPGSTDVPQLLEPNNLDSDGIGAFQEEELKPGNVVGSLGSEPSQELEIPTESPVATTEPQQRSGAAIFLYLFIIGIVLWFVVLETDVLVPLASLFGVDTQLHHLRHDLYLPIRKRVW